jgi:hypothetical protein
MKLLFLTPLFLATLSTVLGQSKDQVVDVHSLPDKISVRMHQANRFTFDQQGDRLLNPQPASWPRKEPTVMLQLTNELGGGVSGLNTVVITSKYPNIVHFRGAAHFRGTSGFVSTGTYMVNRKDPTAVRFQDPIKEFVIWDLRLANESK